MAADGSQALAMLQAAQMPDLILLDMLMPVLDGWGFLKRVTNLLPSAVPPIVITTGSNLTLEWATSHGCAGFVKKPIEVARLLSELNRCLPN